FRVQEAGAQIFHIDCKDLTNDPQALQTARHMAAQLFRTPFNLESGPLLKAMLLKVATDQHVFLFAMHHIISDGWSIQVMVKELLALYNNKNTALPALKIQYKDYAAWLNNQVNDKSWQAHRRYWLQQFEDMGPALQLPADHPRPLARTTNGATLEFEINETLTAGIKALARTQDASVYMCLLATVKVLLHHYSGQDDLVTGMPVAGRVHKDLDEQLGLYVNMLAIRTRLQGKDSFLQLLKNVKQTLLGAYEHQVYPFDQLVEALHLEHDPSRSPLTDVWVQHSDTPWVQAEDANLKITPFETGHTYSKVDLTVKFIETGNTMSVILEYNTDLFEESTMVQMKDKLLLLMNAILQQPEQSLTALNAQLPVMRQHAPVHQLESISNDY
ncbi:MAG TPA: condensation domain-containing protein, partial [Chitinophaga sp.]|uniref:condensation domain-containing protein n=1 Tax=Chitinophaga sp. TaxID=1869181 RepID=UPI002F95B655